MTPDEMDRRCMAWVLGDVAGSGGLDLSRTSVASVSTGRRVVCVEDEGPRRTWTLHESGRQVGLVRMRRLPWTVEASDRTRVMLGLDGEQGPGQTGGEEASR